MHACQSQELTRQPDNFGPFTLQTNSAFQALTQLPPAPTTLPITDEVPNVVLAQTIEAPSVENPYHDALDRTQFQNVELALWSIIDEAPSDWWEPKSEFETESQYYQRMRVAEQDFLQESNRHFTEAESLIYVIYGRGQGNRISGTSKYYDTMVLHPYDPETNTYQIDLPGANLIVFGWDFEPFKWDEVSLPDSVEFIDNIDYIDLLLNGEENYSNTWIYPDVVRLHAIVPADVAQQIRELDNEDHVTVRFFVQFNFPDNLRSYVWRYDYPLWRERPTEPEQGPVVATMLRVELYDWNNNIYFVWD